MPKLINSVAYELGLAKEKNEDLERRIRKLDDEVLQLKAYIKKNNLPLPKAKRSITSQPTVEKGYLQTTKSSRNRSAQPPTQEESKRTESVVICGNGEDTKYPYTKYSYKYRYMDGDLVKVSSTLEKPHYLERTVSSYKKVKSPGPWIQALWERERKAKENEPLGWGDEDDSGYECNRDPVTVQTQYPPANWEYLEKDKTAEELLQKQTEVGRKSPSHLQYVPMRSEFLCDLLKQSLRLAQEIFFHGINNYYHINAEELECPQEVRFGRVEIDSFFGCMGSWTKLEVPGRSHTLWDLKYLIRGITTLRNTVCHYNHWSASMVLQSYDDLLEAVQRLAVFFADERRAFQARALRDKLTAHAEQCLDQLHGMLILAELPGARPWEPHHVRKFGLITGCSRFDSDVKDIPFLILRAAHDWNLRLPTPRWKWRSEELVEQFLSLQNRDSKDSEVSTTESHAVSV
ncbi:hypothetical protein F4814DRAFT_454932 [Daldinia grandis]|nr:hypothetical protein F4814DRAFT_454932 [Daldinia grandis]